MSQENLQGFCFFVLRDLQLQDQLRSLTDREEFIAKVIESGANFGFEITREEIELQMRENRRLWNERWI